MTFLHELDNTLPDQNESLNTTVTLSQMDATYDQNANSDHSIAEAKRVHQAQLKEKVDEKATMRNRYNRTPHPALDTKWERNTYNSNDIKQKAKMTALSQQMAT